MPISNRNIPNFIIGIELECCIQRDILSENDHEIGDYHEGNEINRWWESQHDASIDTPSDNEGDSWDSWECIEIVSYPMSSLKDIKQAFKLLWAWMNIAPSHRLLGIMDINRSCGCHIHFSWDVGSDRQLGCYPLASLRTAKLYHENFLKSKGYNVSAFRSQYYRSYARKTNWYEKYEQRGELNKQELSKGLEWRAFNLQGVRTFQEIEDRIINAYLALASTVLPYLGQEKRLWKFNEFINLEDDSFTWDYITRSYVPSNQIIVFRNYRNRYADSTLENIEYENIELEDTICAI